MYQRRKISCARVFRRSNLQILTNSSAIAFLTLSSVFIMSADSFHMQFDVDEAWIDLLKTLLVTVYVAYFGSRGAEKITKINK